MEFYADTGDLNAIRAIAEVYPIRGFTTNPTILAAQGDGVPALMSQYRDFVREKGLRIFFQTTGHTADEMVAQAKALHSYFGEHFVVKIPAIREGYKATRACVEAGISVLITAVHTVMQAVMAAEAGAEFVAPYVNRIDNMGADGVGTVAQMVIAFEHGGYDCKILGASFRTVDQIQRLAVAGCPCVTLKPELFDQLIAHPGTDAAMGDFDRIWERTYGGRSIADLLPE